MDQPDESLLCGHDGLGACLLAPEVCLNAQRNPNCVEGVYVPDLDSNPEVVLDWGGQPSMDCFLDILLLPPEIEMLDGRSEASICCSTSGEQLRRLSTVWKVRGFRRGLQYSQLILAFFRSWMMPWADRSIWSGMD